MRAGAIEEAVEAPPAPAPAPPPELVQRVEELEAEMGTLRETLATARVELARTAARASQLRAEIGADAEPELVRLALAVAARVVGQELATAPETVLTWLRAEISACALGPSIEVAVAPDIAAVATGEASFAFVIDPALARGTCEIRAGASSIEVSASARMRALVDALEVRS
jgi:flagellar assembly protein FliH